MNPKIKVGVVGSAGYTGGELIRLLINHSFVEIVFLHSQSNADKKISSVHKDLLGNTDLSFTHLLDQNIDVLFLCLGHGDSKIFLEQNIISQNIRIIDLSQDFRITQQFQNKQFVYGLPEMNKKQIQQAQHIANPGCFATAIQLSLLPLLTQPISGVHIVGITGSTGAGQSLQSTSHFSWRANNISAYKTLTHQHLNEIKKNIADHFSVNTKMPIHFVPWRGDFSRGIFISTIIPTTLPFTAIKKMYEEYYATAAFTFITDDALDLKQVINTNKCILQIEQNEDTVVVHAAIDNLLKGASGQALQNMNLMLGLPEQTGLQLKNIAF